MKNNFLPDLKGQGDYFPPPLGAKPTGLGLPPTSKSQLLLEPRDASKPSSKRTSAYHGAPDPEMARSHHNNSQMLKSRKLLASTMGLSSKYPGALPSLGLNKYRNVDLQENSINPYQV